MRFESLLTPKAVFDVCSKPAMSMLKLLKQASRAISAVEKWAPQNMRGMPGGAQGYMGTANGWTFLVVAFPAFIEDEGSPLGSTGYDGTGTLNIAGGTTILRLTRPLAEKAFKLAKNKQLSLNG